MALPKVDKVSESWRPLARVLWLIIVTSVATYVVWNLLSIVWAGTAITFSEQASFGSLPDMCLTSWPPKSAKTVFAFYELHFAAGMEIQNRRDRVNVTATSSKVCFKTSTLHLPAFDKIRGKYPSHVPLPKLSVAVLYKSSVHSPKVEGLYLTIRDAVSNRSRDVGSFLSAKKSLGKGFFDTHLLEVAKQRIVWHMTKETFTREGIASGFKKSEEDYKITRMGVNHQIHVDCSYMTDNSDHSWAGPSVKTDDHFMFDQLPPAKRGEGPCAPELKMVHVMFKFPEDAVRTKEYIGIPVQIMNFCGSIGGLITLGTTLFFMCFKPKNEQSKVNKIYDELTFVFSNEPSDATDVEFKSLIETG